MSSFKLTKRHSRYLSRYKRQRTRLDFYRKDSDIERLRRSEKGHLSLILFFLILAPSWIERLIIWSWWSLPSFFILGWIIYMFYDYYWVSKSVDYMINSSMQDLPSQKKSELAEERSPLKQSNQ
jgi:hypothetical protein